MVEASTLLRRLDTYTATRWATIDIQFQHRYTQCLSETCDNVRLH